MSCSSKKISPVQETFHQKLRNSAIREEIKILRNSLPTESEKAYLFDVDPENAERLVQNCNAIVQRIRQLQEAERETVIEAEERKRAEAKRRANERYLDRRQAIASNWMKKEFSIEERLEERERIREEQISAKHRALVEAVDRSQQYVENALQRRQMNGFQKMRQWEHVVQTVLSSRESERKSRADRAAERTLEYEKVVKQKAGEDAHRRHTMTVFQNKSENDIAFHEYRAALARQSRAARAREIATHPLPHPEAFDQAISNKRAKLAALETQHAQLVAQCEANRIERVSEHSQDLQRRFARVHEHHKRFAESQRMKLETLARDIRERERMNEERRLQMAAQRETRRREDMRKLERVKKATSEIQRQKELAMARKVLERTARVGELPPLIKMNPSAAASESERTTPSRQRSPARKGAVKKQTAAAKTATTAAAEPEKDKEKAKPAEELNSDSAALRIQNFARQRNATEEVERRRKDVAERNAAKEEPKPAAEKPTVEQVKPSEEEPKSTEEPKPAEEPKPTEGEPAASRKAPWEEDDE